MKNNPSETDNNLLLMLQLLAEKDKEIVQYMIRVFYENNLRNGDSDGK